MRVLLPMCLAIVTAPAAGLADPPLQPKVCVMVAGDPDPVIQQTATHLVDFVAARTELRGVADPATRSALLGEPRTESDLAELVSARRTLTGTDGDVPVLEGLGDRLGCALEVEVMARPTSRRFRVYDVVHHHFGSGPAPASIDALSVDDTVVAAAEATLQPSSSAPPATRDASSSPPPSVESSASVAPESSRAPGTTSAPVASSAARSAAPTAAARSSFISTALPWAIAGTAALALIAGFFIAQNVSGSTPVIDVHHTAGASQ